jgi:hypothetical protein
MDQLSGYEKLSCLIIIIEDTKVKSQVGIKIYGTLGLTTNGTAVEGVCVTRRNPPVDCPGCEQGMSPGGPPGMAQFLPSRRTERAELYRYPGRGAMLSS